MVNHRKLILSCTQGFFGSIVDKTIVKFDDAMVAIRDGKYADYEFNVYNEHGVSVKMRGGWVLCDNGYMTKECLRFLNMVFGLLISC